MIDKYIDENEYKDDQLTGKQSIIYDLGNGEIKLEYYFAWIKDHPDTQLYYKKNMESSGIELRINGRYIEHMQFKEVWGNKVHPKQNGLLIWINLVSTIKNRLPSTRTTKSGLNKSDPKVSEIKKWLKDKVSNISQLEYTLLKEEKLICLLKSQIDDEFYKEYKVYESAKKYGRLLVESYKNNEQEMVMYFLCEDESKRNDLYKIEDYWDELYSEGHSIKKVYFIAKKHSKDATKRAKLINLKKVKNDSYNIDLMILDETKLCD